MINRRQVLVMSLLAAIGPKAVTAQTSANYRPYWPTEGWQTGDPEEHGIDPAALRELTRLLGEVMPDVTGLLIVRGGEIVYERYAGGRDEGDPIRVRSVTKSVTSALIGMAIQDGDLALDNTLGELIPDRIPAGADAVIETVTVRHLLTMTSGIAWDIGTDYPRLIGSDNWVELTLSPPVIYQPGTFFAYNTGGSHLLSVILTEATGTDTADYAQERLFDPLGIERPTWQRSPQGEISGGFGLELSPRDMAKFGFLYLNEGRWANDRLVRVSYARASTTYQSDGDSTGGALYGYQWWVSETAGRAAYFALGFGGQYIYVVPELDLLVVVTKGFDTPPAVLSAPRPVIEGLIVPATAT